MNYPEKELLTDVLSGQKQITSLYNSYAGECVSDSLRNEMLNILKDEHAIQSEIFCEMQSKGFYEVKQADTQQINSTKQKLGV